MAYADQILTGCEELGIALDQDAIMQLSSYVGLLAKWNQAFNLTAVRQPEDMVYRHILDSLAILPYISGNAILDVGAGAGLPGIPIAIAKPDCQVTLLDSNGKKTRFMTQVKIDLKLSNIDVKHQRIEQHVPSSRYTTVVSRAFTALPRFVALCEDFVSEKGVLLAMLGQAEGAEEGSTHSACSVINCESLIIPGCDGARHVALLKKSL